MTTRQLRLLRGMSASVVATVLAAVSHTFGGGSAPHPLLILSAAVLLAPPAVLLVGARIRLLRLAAAVATTQGAFHILFEVAGGITPTGTVGGHQHGPIVLTLGPASTEVLPPSTAMLIAHLLAAAVTTLLIWRGELLIQAIARWVRALLRVPQTASSRPRRAPASMPRTAPHILTSLLADCAWRRGPPAPALR
ncbi:hypothetical protein [Microbacterium soli]|uniref:Integral membrane protein n=1 Tax=Microbacterium soli TaxID=446075 RepID=A0ABP7MM29_9MICO